MPKITIGMTSFNSEKTIRKSIESLLCQTWSDFDLIISDDASTDSTGLVCSELAAKDSRIKYVRQEVNIGPLANFSYTLKHAHSEYFMWASHDDLWHPSFIERCIAELEENTDAGFAITRWIVESEKLPFVVRKDLANMDFVSGIDPIGRMLAFTSLPLLSFKDNLTYGVWRREALSRVIDDLTGRIKYFSIGSVGNEYSVLLYRGVVVPDVFMRKRYKWIPPGHGLKKLTELLYRFKFIKQEKPVYPKYTHADHFVDLRTVLEIGGVDESIIQQAINLNKLHHFE
jgi:glycosyltransferase involved in cell wall biosynthesis